MSHLQNFHYKIIENKNKPKLVFLHGLMGYGQNWRSVAREFSNDYEILLFDQRGHGDSFQPPNAYQSQDFADDLSKILEDLNWNKIHLLGHSMGARNAIQFSYLWPEKVEKLIVVDIGPKLGTTSAEPVLAIFDKAKTPYKNKQEAKDCIFKNFDKDMANYLYSNLEEKKDGSIDWRFSKEAVIEILNNGRKNDQWSEWEKLKCPILLVRGEKSEHLNAKDFAEMLERNPKAKGITIKNAGHWLHHEQKEAFVEALKSFL